MTGAWGPITCEHGGDAGLTRELLSRCPICRRDQCGAYNPTVPQVPGSRRKRVERCSKRTGHHGVHSWEESRPAAYSGHDGAVTRRAARSSSSPAAIVGPQDLAAGEIRLDLGDGS